MLVVDIAVGVVFEEEGVVLVEDGGDLLAFFERVAFSRWILEGGVEVDGGGLGLGEEAVEGVGADAVGFERERVELGLEEGEDLDGGEVGGGFEDEGCARFEEEFGGEVYALLGA